MKTLVALVSFVLSVPAIAFVDIDFKSGDSAKETVFKTTVVSTDHTVNQRIVGAYDSNGLKLVTLWLEGAYRRLDVYTAEGVMVSMTTLSPEQLVRAHAFLRSATPACPVTVSVDRKTLQTVKIESSCSVSAGAADLPAAK